MDSNIPTEDQFARLHPCFPLDTKIGIVGAGPSGGSAAYALAKLGYRNVTLLEKYHAVGGMCESVDIEGRVYDLGGQVLAANSAPFIFQLAKETESELEDMTSHKLALIDSSNGKYEDIKVADDYVSVISLTLELQDKAKASGRVGVHAVSPYASDLAPTYLKDHGIAAIPKSVAYGYTASGYGYVEDMPYAYIHEFTRTSMAGKIRRFKEGYTSLWKKLVQGLPIVTHCNTEVTSVKRSSTGVRVHTKSTEGQVKHFDFDKIIISGTFPFMTSKTYRSPCPETRGISTVLMDFSDLEKDLFTKVETIDYYTTVLQIKGLEHMPKGFYYFGEFMEDPSSIGQPVAMQKFYEDTDVFLFWSYGNSKDIMGQRITDLILDVVKNIGGLIEKVIMQRRFKYFPHVSSQDMKNGFYEKLESKLQGSMSTYYVGGLMAFELTERNSSYAASLMCKHFASDSPTPKFPYIKRLFTMIPGKSSVRMLRELGERPGVKYPDLKSLDAYLKYWGTHEATRDMTLYSWLNEEGVTIGQRTYRELDANAECIAQKLLTSQKPVIKPGDRVLLVHVPGLDFVDAFFGCLRARVLPVPVLPPDPLQRGCQALLKIANIANSSKAVAILSSVGYRLALRAGSVKNLITLTGKNETAKWPSLPWINTDSWVNNSSNMKMGSNIDQSEPSPEDLCFLQFTSGSTGDAKGVMITHGGLIHNVKLMRERYRSTSNTVLVSWLPQYHDMGLIGGLFTALVSGGSAVLFSPITFIKNPLLWLDIMSTHKATHSAGPNFAFELVVRRLEADKRKKNYDLSSMIFLMIAAEPVRQRTLRQFVELTRQFGLSQEVMAPGYGLAENCVFVSCAFGKAEPITVDWQGRVCCGYTEQNNPDVDIRIADPETSSEIKEAGKEGEIWISSPSAGVGYWDREDLSKKTFQNELQDIPQKRYTATGDLGRIIDGKLFITGRIKDLIIVAGRNIYSADVEKTVENSSELLRPGCCAVIGVPEEVLSSKGIMIPDNSDQFGLVVIAEVREGKPVSKDVVELIQTRVAEEHGVSIASVKLIKPRTISKTTSGKIKRFECLEQFTNGKLQLAMEPIVTKKSLMRSYTTGTCRDGSTPRARFVKTLQLRPTPDGRPRNSDIVQFLKSLVSEQTKIPIQNVSATESLVSYGIDSIGVVRASQKLSDFLGVPIGAVDIFTATCIADLANFSETLVLKSDPQSQNDCSSTLHEPEADEMSEVMEVSTLRQLSIYMLQLPALMYVAFMLLLPAYLSVSVFTNVVSTSHSYTDGTVWMEYLVLLALAPLSWMLCIFCTCISIALLGNSFLKPNYALSPESSIWSLDFVRWWALYKAQDTASKILAVHLRGTVLLNYWYEMLGARIGSSVLLDTVDITDPSLIWIGDGAVIAEGALLQSHEVKNGVVSFLPIKISRNSTVGPYAVLQKGSIVNEEAEVAALQKVDAGKTVFKSNKAHNAHKDAFPTKKAGVDTIYHIMGVYLVGFFSSFSAASVYFLYAWMSQVSPSHHHFTFACLAGAFHWLPYSVLVYSIILSTITCTPVQFGALVAAAYLSHGLVLILVTSIASHFMADKPDIKNSHLKTWIRHRLTVSCQLRFAKFLSGTEAFCWYLRLLGAKVGNHCSIRAINPISDPELISIGDGVHLGDFSRITSGYYTSKSYTKAKIEVQDNSVVGSQSLILPGSVVQDNVILGALSVAPMHSILQRGGIYIGSETPIMIKNTMHALDERIEEMDVKYKKIIGNLAANLAVTTLKVKSRYFHRIGVSGKGMLKMYETIPGLPEHKIFSPGKSYHIIVRHSNSLSSDDDARIDARGAALRILADDKGENNRSSSILDLTLKTGNAFYARTVADFATWLVCGLEAREEHVKRAPHVAEAVWASLRKADSFSELHYYSNICRLLRFTDGTEMYVKFKLRPYDLSITEDSGKVEPTGILPPETGAIPRDENDTRPLLFLADDFQRRVESSNGVRYILQIQFRPVPDDITVQDKALDCTKPWDYLEYPHVDVGEIHIDQNLTSRESEELEFNPFIRSSEIDVIRATSCTESASIDHGRSLIYEICQHVRNGQPLPEAWRIFLNQSDVKLDLSGCPMAAMMKPSDVHKVTLAKTWYQSWWSILAQPILQTFLPHFLLGMIVCAPLALVLQLHEANDLPLYTLLPLLWVITGSLAGLGCCAAKWVLVGRNRDGESVLMWSSAVFMDTIWQAFRTLVGEYFMDMTTGSVLFLLWMKLMGSKIDISHGTYVDSTGTLLNPEMVEVEAGGCVGREALLFGHIYEGDDGKVKFGKIRVGEGGYVGSRAVVMPGVRVEDWGSLSALTLAMKEEIIKSR